MMYAALRWVHVIAVTLSFCGFAARGIGLFFRARWIRGRIARIVPHVVDTVLLLSAIGMLWLAHLSPLALPWLQAKIAGVLVYIILGSVALRPAREVGATPRAMHYAAWIGALVVFCYIVSVALTKNPLK
jgi:uncharacterized membrane protein SirB2